MPRSPWRSGSLHRTASSSSSIASFRSSAANDTEKRQGYAAYDIDLEDEPGRPRGSLDSPRSASAHFGKTASSLLRQVSSSSSLRSNYHKDADHQAFSSSPRTDDLPDSLLFRSDSSRFDQPLLPHHTPPVSPGAVARGNPFDSYGSSPTPGSPILSPSSGHSRLPSTGPGSPITSPVGTHARLPPVSSPGHSPLGGHARLPPAGAFHSSHHRSASAGAFYYDRGTSGSYQPSRLAAGWANGYSQSGQALGDSSADSSLDSTMGEDKVAEKMKGNGTTPYSRAGLAPVAPIADSGGATAAISGKYASLLPEQAPPSNPVEYLVRLFNNENFCTGMYLILALFTRMYRIGKAPSVIWDEAHFGKFGSHYLKHEFYFDVHPPLGKMIVGLAGLLSGYDGSFEFKSGEHYPDGARYYVGMRIFLAMFGVAMVPIAWSSSGVLGWNKRSRHLLALMVLCDNAWLVISRFILLDSMLLCFTFSTVHGLLKFHQQQNRPFSQSWWFWLTFTGLSIGCVASVKWVGLFVMALVGLYTIEDLWDKFGDLKMPVRTYARHWCARALCLIAIPMVVYMLSFKAHFMILSHSGPGDAQMSSLFQAHLRGNDFAQSPLEAAYGSKVTFKNMGYGGGLLHSHIQTYPVGSQQQQVTCYHYKDNNNDFVITPRWEDPGIPAIDDLATPLRMVKNGDAVRLVHEQTGRNLHSHKIAAPVTKENYEVSAYGNDTIGDSNDYWIVEVVDDMHLGKPKHGQVIRSLTTRMRFRHQNIGCYLRAANAVLPQWGWKQVEVSCDKENNPGDEHTYWNIESHWNDRLPAGNTQLYKSPFLRDFVHLNVAMLTSNNALVPDADKEDILASVPYDWPFLWNGLRMNGWGDDNTKYYLIGNPVIWWGSSISIVVYLLTLLWYCARMQRRYVDLSPAEFNQFLFVGKIGFFGWFIHFLPFMVMARVCYIHHYLPTLYFACILYVHIIDHFLLNDSTARYYSRKAGGGGSRKPLDSRIKNAIFLVAAVAIVGTFLFFHKTALGIDGPVWKYSGRRWRKSWNIYD